MARPTALVVDDEPDLCELLSITLERMQIRTDSCGDVNTAQRMLKTKDYQLCLTDMRLPDGDGLELVDWMHNEGLATPVAVITAHGNVETAVRALKAGAFDFISKPLDLTALRRLVEVALRLSSDHHEASGGGKLLGESAPIAELRTMIDKVARSQAPVHITGESGTGKELVARLIHECGPRADGPFIPVNCGAIPSELMESEFFGHRRGAFTGAVSDKTGLFEAAAGGTLFMDEIADLPLPMQVKLLRVIQEKTVRPVGATEEFRVDVRILSATHKDLRTLVSEGQFREDLYYRVNVIELRVPPLRERRSDIDELTQSILARLATELNVSAPQLDESARQQLAQYAFPGNVRELENILERALALASDGRISASDIHLNDAAADGGDDETEEQLGDKLESVERTAIRKALEANRYNKTAAARQLGLTLRALRYRMQKLGMN